MADKKKNPYDIREIFEAMTLDLIRSLKRNFLRHKAEELKEGFQWEQWQLVKLRNLQKYRKANKEIIGSYSKKVDQLIKEVLQDSFTVSESRVQKTIERVLEQVEISVPESQIDPGSIKPHTMKEIGKLTKIELVEKAAELPKAAPEESFFGVNDKKLEALQKSVTEDLKKAQHAVLRKMDDVYRQTVYKVQIHMDAGAKTLYQAVDMATKEFLEKGINCIEYKDGKRVNVASYAEMALRTASQRSTFLGEGKKRDEWGIYTVVVSAHANTCDLCLPWQGKVLVDDVFTSLIKEKAKDLSKETGYPLLSKAMKAGLLHPNCRHTLATYFPGITQLPKIPDGEIARKNYEAEQLQRHMEREIRKYKRLEAGSLDPENQAKYAEKVEEWRSKLREHLKENPQLRRDYWREKIEGGLTPEQHKEALKNAAETAKVEDIKKFIRSDEQPKILEMGQQRKHILGTNEYRQYQIKLTKKGEYGPSKLLIDADRAQEFVNQYAGTGIIKIKKGRWDNRERIVENDEIVGIVVNNLNGVEVETSNFTIHYGKKGVHIVPHYPDRKE